MANKKSLELDSETLETLKRAFELKGSFQAHRQHHNLSGSQMMRHLIEVEDKKLWRHLGAKSFADYVNSDEIPFGTTHFYKTLKPVFEYEGDNAYDILNENRISKAVRMQLAENNAEIEVEENELRINGLKAPVNDRRAIVELIEVVKGSYAVRDRREDELKKKNKKLERELQETNRTIASLKNGATIGLTTNKPYFDALIDLAIAYKQMFEVVASLPSDEKNQLRNQFFEDTAAHNQRMREVFHVDGLPEQQIELTGESFEDQFDSFMSQVDLDEVDTDYTSIRPDENDEELASIL